jgi:ABC-type sugar transport system permease subunit
MGTVFLIIFCIFIYFLPAIVGCKKQNAYSIFLLNLFLGFTVIGWVVALVWAYTKDPEPKTIIINNDSKSPSQKAVDVNDIIVEKKRGLYKDLESIKSLFDQNIISEEAYNQQRDSLLKKLDLLSNNESAVNTPQQKEQPPRKKRSVLWILILIALLLLASGIYLIYYKGLNPFDTDKQDKADVQNKINKPYFGFTSAINGSTEYYPIMNS